MGALVAGERIPLLGFADDMTVMATSFQEMVKMVGDILVPLRQMGLELSQDPGKCEYMVVAPDVVCPNEW
eukprot:7940607-Karenia_brevis.AAC.1